MLSFLFLLNSSFVIFDIAKYFTKSILTKELQIPKPNHHTSSTVKYTIRVFLIFLLNGEKRQKVGNTKHIPIPRNIKLRDRDKGQERVYDTYSQSPSCLFCSFGIGLKAHFSLGYQMQSFLHGFFFFNLPK